MLTMTEAAAGYLNEVLEEAEAPRDTAIRLQIQDGGLSSALDRARPGDTALHHAGRKVLLLDPQASELLAESTLDLQPTEDGPKLGLS